jgi:threonine dehydratase
MTSIINSIFSFISPNSNTNTEEISIKDIKAAQRCISEACYRTPLIRVGGELQGLGPSFLLKCENLQYGGAFKLRGAYNMISKLSDEQKNAGIITFSSGNHGLSCSLASKMLGLKTCVVVMPTNVPNIKKDGVLRYGGEVQLHGTTTLERKLHAEKEMELRGLTMIPPFDHELILAGQGTIGLEIVEECPLDKKLIVFIPCSGGGLIGGSALAIKSIRPDAVVIGVEPETAPKMTKSLAAGTPVTLSSVSGIADGLLSVRPGDITFKYVKQYVNEVQLVDDTEIAFAVKWLFNNAKMVSEPSGAATVAAVLRALKTEQKDTVVVAVISGGNVNADDYAKYITLQEGDKI